MKFETAQYFSSHELRSFQHFQEGTILQLDIVEFIPNIKISIEYEFK